MVVKRQGPINSIDEPKLPAFSQAGTEGKLKIRRCYSAAADGVAAVDEAPLWPQDGQCWATGKLWSSSSRRCQFLAGKPVAVDEQEAARDSHAGLMHHLCRNSFDVSFGA